MKCTDTEPFNRGWIFSDRHTTQCYQFRLLLLVEGGEGWTINFPPFLTTTPEDPLSQKRWRCLFGYAVQRANRRRELAHLCPTNGGRLLSSASFMLNARLFLLLLLLV